MKKKTTLLPVVLLAFLSLLDYSFEAKAKNNEDTPFRFDFTIYQSQMYATSTGRIKEDDSSVYMKCTLSYMSNMTGDFKYNAIAHGGYSPAGSYSDCWYQGHHSSTYTFQQGNEKLMSNYIVESGKSHAKIFVSQNGYMASFWGLWSPDSVPIN